jgi:hypothetical protein
VSLNKPGNIKKRLNIWLFSSVSDSLLFRSAKYGNAEEIRRYEIQFVLIEKSYYVQCGIMQL